MTTAISLEHLGKQYGRVRALDDVTLAVPEGDVFGFLGLNGAGKTTTIRILLDLVRPTSGRASVFGLDCRRNGVAVRAQIGYLPGDLGFYQDMIGAAVLESLTAMTGRSIDLAWRQRLVDRLKLSSADLRRPIREYSTGMKRKLGLAQAFQSDAPLLILDEPTDGLDPLMQDVVYELIADVRRSGRTVFMSSHVLPEVERVCDRIALLRHGQLVLVATVDEVRRMAARRVRVRFDADVAPPVNPWPEHVHVDELGPREWRLHNIGALGPLVGRLAGLPVSDIDIEEPHLEQVLRRYYDDDAPR